MFTTLIKFKITNRSLIGKICRRTFNKPYRQLYACTMVKITSLKESSTSECIRNYVEGALQAVFPRAFTTLL